jgi:hypothetical protein
MLRLSWAITAFSAQQAAKLVTSALSGQRRPAAADAFDALAHAVEGQFGGVFRGAYKTGSDWIPGLGPRRAEGADSPALDRQR